MIYLILLILAIKIILFEHSTRYYQIYFVVFFEQILVFLWTFSDKQNLFLNISISHTVCSILYDHFILSYYQLKFHVKIIQISNSKKEIFCVIKSVSNSEIFNIIEKRFFLFAPHETL